MRHRCVISLDNFKEPVLAFLVVRFDMPLTQAGIGGLGPWELGIILVIVLVVFGAGKLPGIGGAIGQAIRNFRKSFKEKDQEGPGSKDSDDKGPK